MAVRHSPGLLRGVAATLLAAICAACGLLLDSSDLTGPSTSTDAAPEGALAEASDIVNADAGPDGPLGSASRCLAPHELCDDFDDDAAFPSTRWTTGTGTLSLDEDASTSPPRSLRIGPEGPSSLTKRFAGQLKHLRCEFAFRPETEGDIGFPATPLAAEIAIPDAAITSGDLSGYELRYWAGLSNNMWTENRFLPDGGTELQAQNLAPPFLGRWLTVVIDVDFETREGSLLIGNVDETPLPVAKLQLQPPASYAYVDFILGKPYTANAQSPTERHYDDVICDVTR